MSPSETDPDIVINTAATTDQPTEITVSFMRARMFGFAENKNE